MSEWVLIYMGVELDHLRSKLRRLYVHAGAPSTRLIAAGTGRALSHTTVAAVLRCGKLPTWGQLELVVEQLRGDADEFRQLWIAAHDERTGSGTAGPREPLLDGGGELQLNRAPFGVMLKSFIDHLEEVGVGSFGVTTGITDLDRLLGSGMTAGQLILISGRPSSGKSTLALSMLRAATIRQRRAALFMSWPATRDDVMLRIVSAEARIPLHLLRASTLTDADWQKLASRIGEIADIPLIINDSHQNSITSLAAEIRQAIEDHDIRLVVVDGAHSLGVDPESGTRTMAAGSVSHALKVLARELSIPIVLLASLANRPAGWVRPPTLSDLKSIDGLDDEVDVVIFVHRDDQYDRESPRAGEIDVIVAKHRDGPTDTIVAAAQLHLSRIVEIPVL